VMTALVCMALGLFSVATGLDPPEKMWEETYQDGGIFYDVEITNDSCLILAAHHSHFYYAGALQKVDLEGNMIWQEGVSTWWFHDARDVEVLPNGDIIAVGQCKTDESKTYQVFMIYVAVDGSLQWAKVHDDTLTQDVGYGVCLLPGGGYAVAGRVHGQAWILRTDANGDTLWTDVWGTHTINYACGVEYDQENDWIAVLAYGRSDSLQVTSPHMLYYTLDGEYLFGTSYPETPGRNPSDLCRAADGGYTFVSEYGQGYTPIMSHTDELGELLWFIHIYGFAYGDAYGIDRTVLDDGYLVSGFAVDSNWALAKAPGRRARVCTVSTVTATSCGT